MSVIENPDERETGAANQRPPKATVGSHHIEEEVFGKAYDPRTIRRIWVVETSVSEVCAVMPTVVEK